MRTELHPSLPQSVRFSVAVTRFLTWGLPAHTRKTLHWEMLADWCDMHREEGAAAVIVRALRGVPSGVLSRLDTGETTTLPVAVAASLVGVAAIASSALGGTYPMDIRRFILISAVGAVLGGAVMFRDPRRLVLRRLRVPGMMISVGFVGMAMNIPTPDEWMYDTPYADTPLIDSATAAGFVAVGTGFAMVVLASFLVRRRVLAIAGAGAIGVGTAVFACAQIAWGITAVTVDPAITVTSISVGLAALSFLHAVPRLRNLQIV